MATGKFAADKSPEFPLRTGYYRAPLKTALRYANPRFLGLVPPRGPIKIVNIPTSTKLAGKSDNEVTARDLCRIPGDRR